MISKNQTYIDNSNLLSKNKDININSIATIASTISVLKANNISLNSREGNIYYSTATLPTFNNNGDRQYASLYAGKYLALNAGGSINLSGVIFNNNEKTELVARNDLIINNHANDLITHKGEAGVVQSNDQARFDRTLSKINNILSRDGILVKSGGNLSLSGVTLHSASSVDLISNGTVIIDSKKTGDAYKKYLPSTRTPSLSSRIGSSKDLLINSGGALNIKSANLYANNITLLAGSTISLLSTAYSAIATPDEDNRDDRHVITQINARRNLTLATNGDLIASGSSLSSIGDMTLSSRGKMEFNALKNYAMREGNNEFNESTTQQNVVLNSGGVLTLLSNSSILFQATSLVAKGAMDVAAKGGFLYAQAMEETNHYEQESSSRTWYGKKKKGKRTYHNVSNKVAEFTAGSNINLLSRDDSIYEASKIAAGKNAKLTSTKGQVIFKAVKNTTFEQTITTSKGFFIKNSDRGYTKDTWLLPSIHAGGQFTVDAATGVSAAVKTRNAQSLQNALLTLSNTPGATWLKGLNTRKDVQWNAVQDAYTNWNHTTQSLNPVVGAVIAIAVAAVTAGAGLAGMAATAAVNAAGATGMTATVMSGAVYSGMTALTSQAAVALVDNKGNLTKTMQTLGNSASVKSLVTSMAIGGALAGFDSVLKVSNTGASPTQTKLPMLSNGDWNKVAQRIAGQSVISSSIGTAINGGSFKDNFTTALLSNIGSQINAEGAKFIGDNGTVLGVTGKTLSHAVVAGVAAEISGGNVKGAAAGALAAELAAISLGNTFVDPALREIQITSTGRIIGALAGAAITGKASGVNSGASAAESVLQFNFLMHEEPKTLAEKYAACKGSSDCESNVRKEMNQTSVKNQEIFEGCRAAGNSTCINDMLYGISEASGYDELGRLIGFDLSNSYKEMGQNAYDRANICGGDMSYGCGLKLWADQLPEELLGGILSWGIGKAVSPLIGKYFTEAGILSAKETTNRLVNGKWVDANGLPLPVPPSVGAAGRVPVVLQTGGHTMAARTANGLNKEFNKNLTNREWGRALEALKKYENLDNNFHGRILDNGDYIDHTGRILGNIGDFL
ncbi:DUF637 domain-containing protein [Pectobacterium brasiliense]|uniref:DUF637 domain-containing protein n=1 Tax=Pectobacterium brasiliense TaxID=180957 RepID=UPI00300E1BFF